MRAKLPVLLFTVGLLVAGCFEQATLKADSEADFDASFATMTQNMSSADRDKLDAALKDIVLVEVGLYGPLRDAKTLSRPSGQLTSPLAQTFVTSLNQGMSPLMDMAIAASWQRGRAKLVVENARAVVGGRSAKAILAVADDERKKARDEALAIYREELTKAKAALNDARKQDEAALGARAEQQIILQSVKISSPRFSYQKTGFVEQPIISFTISNDGTIPIKRIFMHGKVQTAGRAIPWVADDFNYEFPGGLEPKEKQTLSLSPNMFSDWGKVPKDAAKGSILDLKLLAFEDASAKKYGNDEASDQETKGREKALEDGVKTLEDKIKQLEIISAPSL